MESASTCCIVGRLLSQPEALINVAPSNLGASVVMGPISFSLLKELGLVEVSETPTWLQFTTLPPTTGAIFPQPSALPWKY